MTGLARRCALQQHAEIARRSPNDGCRAIAISGGSCRCRARRTARSRFPRYTLTPREAAASLGISINHFERRVQPELKVVISGQLILIPMVELERWVQCNARRLVEIPGLGD